jgi:hypothetical protein
MPSCGRLLAPKGRRSLGFSCLPWLLLYAGSVPRIVYANSLYAVNTNTLNGNSGAVEVFGPNGTASVFADVPPPGGAAGAAGLAFDGANLYVTVGTSVEKITPNGAISTYSGYNASGVLSLAFDQSGDLFVGAYSFGNGGISEITPGGAVSTFATNVEPAGLAFNSSGDLFVSDGSILDYTPSGSFSVFANVASYAPAGLAFDSHGNLFVAEVGEIEEFTPAGVGSLFATTSGEFYGVAIDSNDNVYTSVLQTNTIDEFSAGGALLQSFSSGGLGVRNLAFGPDISSSTPEPAPLLLTLIGLAFLVIRRAICVLRPGPTVSH